MAHTHITYSTGRGGTAGEGDRSYNLGWGTARAAVGRQRSRRSRKIGDIWTVNGTPWAECSRRAVVSVGQADLRDQINVPEAGAA